MHSSITQSYRTPTEYLRPNGAVRAAAKHRAAFFNKKVKMKDKEKSVRAQINDLEIGASVDFPLARYEYVVSCRTKLGFTTGKAFESKTDRERGVVTITRIEDPASGQN